MSGPPHGDASSPKPQSTRPVSATDARSSTVSLGDVMAFGAELTVYVSVGWWGATRGLPVPGRVLLAVLAVAGMAWAWGVFAAPRARRPLSGARATTFKTGWFALGALALFVVVRGS